MIDPNTGTIIVGDLRLKPELTEQQFLGTETGKEANRLFSDGIRASYKLLGEVNGFGLAALHAHFYAGVLKNISLALYNPDEQTWDSWSEAKELAKKREHDNILYKDLGTGPRTFLWGDVLSTYDPRSGSSSIVVSYDTLANHRMAASQNKST